MISLPRFALSENTFSFQICLPMIFYDCIKFEEIRGFGDYCIKNSNVQLTVLIESSSLAVDLHQMCLTPPKYHFHLVQVVIFLMQPLYLSFLLSSIRLYFLNFCINTFLETQKLVKTVCQPVCL